MFKFKYILLAISLIVLVGCKNDDEGKIEFNPDVVTQNAGNLEMFSATIYGKLVLPDIRKEDFTFGFEYFTDQAFSALKLKRVECAFYNTQNGNMFSSSLTNLTMATAYYYRAYITYKGVTYYGDVMTFTTKGVEVITGDMDPSTFEVTSKVEMGADFNKIIYGLCFGATENLSVQNSVIGTNEAEQDGSYTLRLNDIPYGEFFYRAYVTINDATFYGEVKSLEGNKVVTGELDEETMTVSAWVRFPSGYDNFTYGICYGTSSSPSYDRDKSVNGDRFDQENNFTATLTRLPFGKVYYRAYITIGQKVYYGETYSFDHYMKVGEPVDLGVSVKWADINIGAYSETDYGIFVAWAETEEKELSIRTNYKYGEEDPHSYMHYSILKYNMSNTSYSGVTDNKTVLEPMDDAATVHWGENWRTPSPAEFKELVDNCEWTWMNKDGVDGYKVFSNATGNSIFLPAGGAVFSGEKAWEGTAVTYWTNNLYDSDPYYSIYYYLANGGCYSRTATRYSCFNVRAVNVK